MAFEPPPLHPFAPFTLPSFLFNKKDSHMVNSANELPTIVDSAVKLVRDERGLALVGDGMELRCDLARMLPRIKPGKLQHELLVKAAKVKGAIAPRAIDATAGFGEDALLLAAAGFDVQLYEADPVIAALLADGLERAAADAQLTPLVARMHLTQGDSVAALRALTNANCEQPDSERFHGRRVVRNPATRLSGYQRTRSRRRADARRSARRYLP